MKKSKLAVVLSACISLGCFAPTFAADDNSGLEQTINATTIVPRLGGVGAALVLGTPVAIGRSTVKSYLSMTESCADKLGGHDFGPSCLLAGVVCLPPSLLIGTAKGVYYGGKNAVLNGFDSPFNSSSFSLSSNYDE